MTSRSVNQYGGADAGVRSNGARQPYRSLDPLPGEADLDKLAGLSDLIRPGSTSDVSLAVANGTTVAVVGTRIGKGREGLLVAYSFDFGSQDYQASPWALRTCARLETDALQGFATGDLVAGPYKTPVGSLTQPFIMPYPVRIPKDKEIAIVVKNGSAASYDAQGFLYWISWDYEQNRDVRRALYGEAVRRIWPQALFGGA